MLSISMNGGCGGGVGGDSGVYGGLGSTTRFRRRVKHKLKTARGDLTGAQSERDAILQQLAICVQQKNKAQQSAKNELLDRRLAQAMLMRGALRRVRRKQMQWACAKVSERANSAQHLTKYCTNCPSVCSSNIIRLFFAISAR
jgi:hypothetical protein